MSSVEAPFWDLHVEPTWHALERFAERAQPPSFEWDYLRSALRDLAVAEGWLAERPPGWARLAHDASLYVVIGRWLCLPLRPDRRRRRWQPTTVVNEYDELTWSEALARRRIELEPRPAEPPAPLAADRVQIELYKAAHSAIPTPPEPPPPSALPLTPRRWRAWRAWRSERAARRTALDRRRAAWIADQRPRLEAEQQARREARERWRSEVFPAHEQAWRRVYTRTRAGATPPSERPAWWRKPPI